MASRKSKKRQPQRAVETVVQPEKQPAPAGRTERKQHVIICAVALFLASLAYSNALRGEFVYDDDFQIVKNRYVQQNQHFWEAMTTDVWAFRSPEESAQSNYWRPLFVAWLAMNYRLFGLDTTGWHVLNILAHLLVTLLAYRVLVALKLRMEVSALVTWAFASHPVHVQSVTWISGIPDVLMAGFLFGSFLCYLALRKRQRWYLWAGALLLYFAALLSKEVAITFPAIILLTNWILDRENQLSNRAAINQALKRSLPFLAVGIVFVVARYEVLQMIRRTAPDSEGLGSVLLTLPSILFFYIRQVLFPIILSPFHPFRPVTTANIGIGNFLLPLVLTAVTGYLAYRLFRRGVAYRHGLVWFLIPLATALDTRVFTHEQQVQDRYLYLPLFGALIVFASFLVESIERLRRSNSDRLRQIIYTAGLVIAIILAIMTIRYNPVWNNDQVFMEYTIRIDPNSAIAHYNLAEEYMKQGRLEDARSILTRALEIAPKVAHINVSMGRLANLQGRYAEAAAYLEPVVKSYPQYALAVDQLGLAYQQQGKTDQAIAVFDRGRQSIPHKRVIYTNYIAKLQRIANRPAQSLAELEAIIPQLNSSTDPNEVIGWFYLGELYRELGKRDQAANAYERYIRSTRHIDDPEVRQLHQQIFQLLEQLKQ